MAYRGWRSGAPDGEEVLRRYVDAMSAVAVRLLADGHTIRVLVGEHDDAVAVNRLLESVAPRGRESAGGAVIVEPIDDFAQLLAQVALTDAVVATRFHNVIAALMMARPTVSIGYAEKNRELMDSFGLGSYCHSIERIDPERVVDDLYEVIRLAPERADEFAEVNRSYAELVAGRFGQALGSAGPADGPGLHDPPRVRSATEGS
jgi:polysaccharide pyruvyl transferase WcaK-like protein